jgi:hypothetical protein
MYWLRSAVLRAAEPLLVVVKMSRSWNGTSMETADQVGDHDKALDYGQPGLGLITDNTDEHEEDEEDEEGIVWKCYGNAMEMLWKCYGNVSWDVLWMFNSVKLEASCSD